MKYLFVCMYVCVCLGGGLLSIGEDASFTGRQEALVSVVGWSRCDVWSDERTRSE